MPPQKETAPKCIQIWPQPRLRSMIRCTLATSPGRSPAPHWSAHPDILTCLLDRDTHVHTCMLHTTVHTHKCKHTSAYTQVHTHKCILILHCDTHVKTSMLIHVTHAYTKVHTPLRHTRYTSVFHWYATTLVCVTTGMRHHRLAFRPPRLPACVCQCRSPSSHKTGERREEGDPRARAHGRY